jgi:hypothetical protein
LLLIDMVDSKMGIWSGCAAAVAAAAAAAQPVKLIAEWHGHHLSQAVFLLARCCCCVTRLHQVNMMPRMNTMLDVAQTVPAEGFCWSIIYAAAAAAASSGCTRSI